MRFVTIFLWFTSLLTINTNNFTKRLNSTVRTIDYIGSLPAVQQICLSITNQHALIILNKRESDVHNVQCTCISLQTILIFKRPHLSSHILDLYLAELRKVLCRA